MADLYFLSFRDISSTSTGVTAGELYSQSVDANTDWMTAVLSGGNWVPWEQVPSVFRGKRVCFVLHGFNVSSVDGQKSCGPLAQSCKDLGAFALDMTGADIVVPVLWPGDGFIGWSYITAFNHAEAAGQRFAEFLASSAFTGAEVSFISHSLGARVVLETVSQAVGKSRAPFNTAILMAPAVDETALDDPKFAAASGPKGLQRIVVLSSVQDQILQYWFAIGDAVETALWWDYKSDSRALGRFGPVFQDGSTARPRTEWYAITPSDDPKKVQDHGNYLPAGGPPPDQGWTDDRPKHVGLFCRDVMNQMPFAEAELVRWASDNTGRFRAGWKARF